MTCNGIQSLVLDKMKHYALQFPMKEYITDPTSHPTLSPLKPSKMYENI